MRLAAVHQIPYSQRVGPYHFQMIQAKLSGPVQPITGYNLQPFYTRHQQWMTDLADSLSHLYRYTAELNQAAGKFDASRPQSVLYARLALSSRPDTLQAKAGAKAKPGRHQVEVARLASPQVTIGMSAENSGPSPVSAGLHSFTLTAQGQEKLLTVLVSSADTHEQALRRIAGAIQQSDSGVTSVIEYQGAASRLVLRSLRSGSDQGFALADRDGSLVRALGLDRIARVAEDAAFAVDGMWSSSPGNQVELMEQVTATLLQPGKVVLQIEPDLDGIVAAARDWVDRFNRLHRFLEGRPQMLMGYLSETLQDISLEARAKLGDFGLRATADRSLELDEEWLRHALERDYPHFVEKASDLSRLIIEMTGAWRSTPPSQLTGLTEEKPYGSPSPSFLPRQFFKQAVYTGLLVNQLW
ncbi:hypothetical protein KDJ56_06655 [Brevibacillus composti]|uniref:Filament cap protein n=1 Tax=Brevibacillus composti TaxID=2796470 RepID=A0ABX7Z6F2_9BACL|nr:flagellar cap protein FliD N-terminal domain-containing protein [Brevibacillus composti]QUO42647.1 hypothetical protein KDJ56_06655 [Brevibacillus composti]